ncbi:hypothetical protein E2562_010364 [Oryza meyeriana var. granulata]|uniref:Uncharacterized protein n=1 Tax=Oryza meyeriana var. granulata TaxID=110450 RepID=A0A6G1F6J7_9ORYZ|nr:hypothetical protein E2562_010364 [Oryza meyeriana var. granulata]
MGDGEGRTVVFKAVREAASVVPAVISEAPTKHFARHANAAMGLLSPVGEAANTLLLDLAAGALIPEPTINIEGTLIPKVLRIWPMYLPIYFQAKEGCFYESDYLVGEENGFFRFRLNIFL